MEDYDVVLLDDLYGDWRNDEFNSGEWLDSPKPYVIEEYEEEKESWD
jgi:hypothetical protein